MRFEFATATRIVFGAGTILESGRLIREMGRRALLVTGRSPEDTACLSEQLCESGVTASRLVIEAEPGLNLVQQGIEQARQGHCDVVIGFGGGSSIDAGKAVAAMLTNEGSLLDYLEVIGGGRPLERPSAPFIAIPTTAGTGAEVTRNAVIASPEHKVKASLRSHFMLPRLALVDPELTFDLPPAITASTGLDALTQLIEPYVSCRANPMTDAVCVEGMKQAARSLLRAYENGRDAAARTGMAAASLMGGLALANAGLGIVHGFAAPIGGMFPAPHGAACAALLPPGMSINIRALRARDPHGESLRRYETVAEILSGRPGAAAEEGAQWVANLCAGMKIAPLRSYGVSESDVPSLVEKAAQASSTKGNPIALHPDEMADVIRTAI